MAHLKGEINKVKDSSKKNKEKKLQAMNKKMVKLGARKEKLDSKLETLKTHKRINDPINAYVTFETNQGFIRCIDNYPRQTCAWFCQSCCKGKEALINEKYRVWLAVAPEAENIWWENIATGAKMRACRKFISTIITLTLLICSITGVSVVKGSNARLARLYPPVDCQTLTAKYDGEITKSDVELDEMMLTRIETNETITASNVVANVSSTNATTTGTKSPGMTEMDIRFVKKVSKDSLLQCYCTKIISNPVKYGDFRSEKYYFKPLKDIKNLSQANITIKIPHKDTEYEKGNWCVKFAFDYAQIQGLTIFGVMLVIIINIVLKMVMKMLVKFEHPHSKSEYSVSLANKLFIVQLINTAVILLIVNGNLSSMGISDGFIDGLVFGGDHDDFNSQWYVTIGSSLVLTMMINMLSPLYSPVGNCVTRGMKRVTDRAKCLFCCGQDKQFSNKVTQAEYEGLWSGGDFELPARYGQLQMVYWVTMLYGTGLPVLYPLALCYFTLQYWVDKWALTKLYDKPMQTDEKLASSITSTMIYAIIAHIIFATWKYSNSTIFQGVNVMESMIEAAGSNPPQSLLDITDVIRCGTGGGISFALTRIVLTAPHMFALTAVLLLFVMMYRLILPIFGTLLRIACPCVECCLGIEEEDTILTVQEAIDESKLQGAKSYDITANRTYAVLFALEEEGELNQGDIQVTAGEVEMVTNPMSPNP